MTAPTATGVTAGCPQAGYRPPTRNEPAVTGHGSGNVATPFSGNETRAARLAELARAGHREEQLGRLLVLVAVARCSWCATCGAGLAAGERVWRYRLNLGPNGFGRWQHVVAPSCARCTEDNYDASLYRNWEGSPCEGCSRPVVNCDHRWRRHTFCSTDCAIRVKYQRRKADHHERPCDHCGATYTPARVDARYCSSACRQAAYRQRARRPEAKDADA